MEYIKLKDGTIIAIIGATSNSFTIIANTSQDFKDTYDNLKAKNLEEYSIVNEEGEALAFFKDKEVKSARLEGDIATFDLKDVDITTKRIKALEETVDTLVIETLGV
ncbi:MAG TPA: hypothetical protein DHW61_05480 [Lachnoclostridium phytofermentans]|uniref:Uncharacterized protein n=1 Tax=Lachnoclostridium phytofermentans TaxID=66219 RepID=A0A3D2X568_9FIRM|nr:hypothetical protein [Lachnoclostridium sp.]HCL01857.1 hypothetical protein [Lachnoclostridium phytofermentans]